MHQRFTMKPEISTWMNLETPKSFFATGERQVSAVKSELALMRWWGLIGDKLT